LSKRKNKKTFDLISGFSLSEKFLYYGILAKYDLSAGDLLLTEDVRGLTVASTFSITCIGSILFSSIVSYCEKTSSISSGGLCGYS
jgi:hypothetical protein